MKVEQISHIGIAVTNLQEAVKFYTEALGLEAVGFETVEEQKATVAFVPCGEARFELLESISPDGPIGKFVEKNGGRGGIHHIAVEVRHRSCVGAYGRAGLHTDRQGPEKRRGRREDRVCSPQVYRWRTARTLSGG